MHPEHSIRHMHYGTGAIRDATHVILYFISKKKNRGGTQYFKGGKEKGTYFKGGKEKGTGKSNPTESNRIKFSQLSCICRPGACTGS